MDVLDGIYKNENQAVISMGCDTSLSDGSIVKKIILDREIKGTFICRTTGRKKGGVLCH